MKSVWSWLGLLLAFSAASYCSEEVAMPPGMLTQGMMTQGMMTEKPQGMMTNVPQSMQTWAAQGLPMSAPTGVHTSSQAHEQPSAPRLVRIGILTFTEPDLAQKAWQETANHLSATTGYRFELIALTPSALDAKVQAKALDFIISNQFAAVGYKQDYGASQLLTLIPQGREDPAKAVGSALVVRAGHKLADWRALSRLRLVSADTRGFGGFLIFAGELARRGMDPMKDLPGLSFVGFPQSRLLELVHRGEADVAVLPACVMEQAIARGDYPEGTFEVAFERSQAQMRCAVSSELYPATALTTFGHTNSRLATEVAKALLLLDEHSPAAQRGGYLGWSVPVDDNRVFALKRTLREWPFQTNWQRVANVAMPWAGAIALCLLLGYLHHLRIKRLVVRRTQALESEIQHHRETQKAFNEQQRQFYQAQRVLLTGEMASGISHELKQPLAGIRYLTQGCLYRLGSEASELKTALCRVLTQVDRAQDTITRLRSFCQQPTERRFCRVDSLINETLTLISPELKRLQLTPRLKLEHVEAWLDPALMTQVLVNVFINALDAMAKEPEPALEIVLEHIEDGFNIRVADRGCGLTQAQISKLFFPFESAKSGGLGLGMVICKRIVEEHGGTISAHNRYDHHACDRRSCDGHAGDRDGCDQHRPIGLEVIITLKGRRV